MVGDILQPTHLLFVLVVALLVLGPKRLPEVGRTLGNGIRDFRSAINGEHTESREEIASEPWHGHPDPTEKHEFAHTGETTPETHEFAHEQPVATTTATEAPASAESAPAQFAPAQPAAATPADAQPVQPATTSDTPDAPAKHEFAYESSEAADNSAGPRS